MVEINREPEKINPSDSNTLLDTRQVAPTSLPKNLNSVLAKIRHQSELGTSTWYEVVYFDSEIDKTWKSYGESTTFESGEQVLAWRYAEECF